MSTAFVIASRVNFQATGANRTLQHATVPELRFQEDDQTDPAGRFRWVVSGDSLILQRAATADFATFSTILTLVGSTLATLFAAAMEITGGQVLRSSDGTEIGIQVTNSALAVGSLGSMVLPVKTDGGAPNDAQAGNLVGAIAFNSNDSTLEVRTGVDTFISVVLGGTLLQRRAPAIEGAWYHPRQLVGDNQVDETLCPVCGDQLKEEEPIALWGNATIRNDDLHAIFGHLHLERDAAFRALGAEVAERDVAFRALEAEVLELKRGDNRRAGLS